MKKVTVIIPAYNSENTIENCIIGVCRQSYGNLEIIIINDGSEDRTKEICHRLACQDSRIKIKDIANHGVSFARNVGLALAEGDYIFFLDSDDEMEKDCIESLLYYSSQCEWVIGNYSIIDKKNHQFFRHEQYFNESFHLGTKEELPELCNYRNFHCVWGKLYNANIIRKYHIKFDIKRNYGEDIIFNMEYFHYVHQFVIVQKEVYKYCFEFGRGLGTRLLDNEWDIQKDICMNMQYYVQSVYRLNVTQAEKMNHFYFSQFVAVIRRIYQEDSLSCFEKKKRIKIVTESKIFRKIIHKEYKQGRISWVDLLLLKDGLVYLTIHEKYASFKRFIKEKFYGKN